MPAPSWLHCGDCATRGTGRWFLSSCGRIVCSECQPQLKVNHCNACRGPCSRTVELTSRAPTEVKNLFADPSETLKPVSKMLDFQEKHKRSFLAAMAKRLADLDAKHKDSLRQKEERIVAIKKAKTTLAQLHKDIEEKKKLLRNGAPSDWNSRDRPGSQSSLYNRFPNKHQIQDQPSDFFSTPKKQQNETYGVNDVGFLQLKTPGVFHGDKVDQLKIKDPAKRKETSASSNNSRYSMEKTPIREKIRQRQRDRVIPSFFSPDYDKYDSKNPQRGDN